MPVGGMGDDTGSYQPPFGTIVQRGNVSKTQVTVSAYESVTRSKPPGLLTVDVRMACARAYTTQGGLR